MVRGEDDNPRVSTCVSGYLLFEVQSSEGCLEEHGYGVLAICSCVDGSVYLMCCMPLTDHLLFSCSS